MPLSDRQKYKLTLKLSYHAVLFLFSSFIYFVLIIPGLPVINMLSTRQLILKVLSDWKNEDNFKNYL